MSVRFSRALAGLCLGVALGSPVKVALAAGPAHAPAATQLAGDVRLYQGDGLVGQTLNAAGVPEAGIEVALLSGDRRIAALTSGESGYFVIKNVRPGAYTLAAGEARTPIRAWTGDVAPPTAAELAVVSSNPEVVRGQWFSKPSTTTTVLVVGGAIAVAGGVALAITLADDDAS